MKTIAIITARGGSKRIPRKNIQDFCGKPIVAYSICVALESGLFDTVMVSTDDEEIAQIAKEYGAEVPFFRSAETSNDYATTNDVLLEVISEYEKKGIYYDLACCIYPTAPFISTEKIKEAFQAFVQSDADTLIPVVRFSYPPQRAMVIEAGHLVFKYPEFMDSRSQDLEPQFHDVGQFYLFHISPFKRNKKLMLGKILPFVISELDVQVIDTRTHWSLSTR